MVGDNRFPDGTENENFWVKVPTVDAVSAGSFGS